MFRKLSIRAKLVSSFLLISLIFVISSVFSIGQLRSVRDGMESLVEGEMRGTVEILNLVAKVEMYRATVAEYLLQGTDAQYEQIGQVEARVEEAAANVEAVAPDEQTRAAFAQEFGERW